MNHHEHENNQDEKFNDQGEQNRPPKMNFARIAPDVMVEIAECLDNVADLHAIAHSCRIAYYSINPVLYKYDARNQRKALWAPGSAVENRFQLSFAVGAKINVPLRLEGGVVSSPLHMAIKHGDEHVVRYLIHYGADVHGELDPMPELTPLQEAALLPSPVIAEILLRNGADINKENESGYTPLDIALRRWAHNITYKNKADMLKLLLTTGAVVDDLGYGWQGRFILPKRWRNKLAAMHGAEITKWWETQMTGQIDTFTESTGVRTSDLVRALLRNGGLEAHLVEYLLSHGLQPDDMSPEELNLHADELEAFVNDGRGTLHSKIDEALEALVSDD